MTGKGELWHTKQEEAIYHLIVWTVGHFDRK